MILDITYHDKAPEQIRRVRMTTVYTSQEVNAQPELIVHSVDYVSAPRYIPLSEVKTIRTTND